MRQRHKLRNVLAALGALVAAAATPAGAQVPDPYARELAHGLAQAETALGGRGFSHIAGPFAGDLPAPLNRRIQLTLRAGQQYEIIGICDGRCRNLDLKLYDPNDRMVAQDVAINNVPVLDAQPMVTGLYTVEVTMAQCAGDPCYYAFNVYARWNGAGN